MEFGFGGLTELLGLMMIERVIEGFIAYQIIKDVQRQLIGESII